MRTTNLSRLFLPLFGLCLGALALGQYAVLYSFGSGSIYLFDLFLALFDGIGLVYLLTIKQTLKIPVSLLLLLTFCAFGAASLAFSPLQLEPMDTLVAASYLVRFLTYVLCAALLCRLTNLGVIQVDKLHRGVVYTGLVLFAAGLVQLVILPDLATLNPTLGWDPHKNRMASTLFDPNFLGMYFVICLAAAVRVKTPATRRLATHYLPILMLLMGILLTFSRSAWLATAILLLFSLLRQRLLLLSSLAVLLLAVFAIPRVQTRLAGITDPQDSASFRLVSWQTTWEITRDNWVFGIGYNAFRYAQQEYGFLGTASSTTRSGAGSDASLLLVLATTGIFGLICFGGYFGAVLAQALSRRDTVIVGLILALLVDSLFINSLFYPQIAVVSLLLFTVPAQNGGR